MRSETEDSDNVVVKQLKQSNLDEFTVLESFDFEGYSDS